MMKKIHFLFSFWLLIIQAFDAESATTIEITPTSKIVLNIAPLDELNGNINVAVFAEKVAWLSTSIYAHTWTVSQANCHITKCVLEIEQLDYGTYGIALYHDVNSNHELDRNFLGMPTESYGFSNNVTGVLGTPPEWGEAVVTVDSQLTELVIQLR